MKIVNVVLVIVIVSASALAQSSAGFVDYSFGNEGKVQTSYSSAGFSNGKCVVPMVGGEFLVAGITYHNPDYRFSVLKYKSNGTLDAAFGNGGRASLPATSIDKVAGMVVLPNGKIVIGGSSSVDTGTGFKLHFSLLRFTPDGLVDSTFGTGGKVVYPSLSDDRDSMAALSLQVDGKFVMAGDTGNPTPNTVVVLRANSDGSLDSTFDGDGIKLIPIGSSSISDYAAGSLIQPDGKIVIVGNAWETGRDVLLIRLNDDGTFDQGFGGDGIITTRILGQASFGYAVALQADGKLVVAGGVLSAFLVVRFNANGSLDTTFDNDGLNYMSFGGTRSYPSSLAIQKNGRIVLGGYADGPSTTDHFALARFTVDGALDTSFGGDGRVVTIFADAQSIGDKIQGMALQTDGKLIAVGEGGTYPPSIAIARYRTSNGSNSDFDGDGRSDVSIFRPTNGQWWLKRSSQGVIAYSFGETGDRIVPGDFTGDGKADVAFWRPSTGWWFILRSEDSSFYSFPFGATSDLPVSGDFDGDGTSDPAVFRPSTGTWYVSRSSDGETSIFAFGTVGDLPAVADYDGDGMTDIAIYRPSSGQWWINRSTNGVIVYTFGSSDDKIVPADFTGDGRADVAFWRQTAGEWFILRSEDSSYYSFSFGVNSDIEATGDFDGDGKSDAAVFRPSSGTWFILRSSDNDATIQQFGMNGDIPTQSASAPH